ncbi:potassium transporter [Striga asiatica]|uniref:Potassium transporter n=1 Tax=Striga asiatica TaxID=4170 RepID=A0A5A7Q7J9_STRAF|nr:potassium transporter [Striga asiatica]
MASGVEFGEDSDSKGGMWVLEQKLDQPMDEEAGRLKNMYREKLSLRQFAVSLGVVYGDLGTSPLYVFYNTFPHNIDEPEDVIDEELTTYSRSTFHEHSFAAKTKRWLEAHAIRRTSLLILVLVGTCMVIGDGILTPAISVLFVCNPYSSSFPLLFKPLLTKMHVTVLSASGGIKVDHPKMSNDVVVLVAVFILVGLFSVQHYGTDKVGWLFAPIVLLWFLMIGGIGIFNLYTYDTSVLRAFSPVYIYRYLKRGTRKRWTSLGGIMLRTEALFADLAHFPVSAIQLAFTVVVFPCLLLAYSGQAAYLMENQEHATISATFSIIKQALALGCFPRVKVVHTSKKFLGQIYIPDINWILMILCIAVTAGFRNQSQIGNAYGTAVVIVMLVTTLLMTLIMLLVWHCHWLLVLLFTFFSLLVECTYFSAVLFKVDQGGWVPLVIAAAFLIIMYVWHYGTVKRYELEMHSKLASGVPHIFSHFITNLPAIHSVVVFVCVKYLPVYTVPEEERYLVKRIGPKNFHMFRCVARYGYKDLHKKDDDFEKKLFDNLFTFVRLESMMEGCSDSDEYSIYGSHQTHQSRDFLLNERNNNGPTSNYDDDLTITECRNAGLVHIMGNTVVRARRDSGVCKKVAVDYVYAFLRKICRENSAIFNVPHESLLNVGQIFFV